MSMPAQQLQRHKTLADLLRGFAEAPPLVVQGIASDSRNVHAGDLFLACGGATSHGLDHLEDAVAAGAAAVAFDSSTATLRKPESRIPVIPVARLAMHVGTIANRFHDWPSRSVGVIGVTGTNGKTTVAWLLRQCLLRLDRSCAYVGTLGSGLGEIAATDTMTTPDAVRLHAQLAAYRDAGARYAAIEVSSHALAQNRVAGVEFDTVLFTNMSRDHLDYHGDMRSYAEAKALLFTACPSRNRIINLDTEFGTELAARCGQDVITVSTKFDRVANGRRYVFARSIVAVPLGARVRVSSSWGAGEFALPLVGEFNVANAVLVLAFLLQQGIPMEEACAVLGEVQAPPGRMQRVPAAGDLPAVYIDYAHTPDALDQALLALRVHCAANVWCVFGCGGERDAGKRPQMGRIAEHRANRVVVTSDNPRREDAGSIIAQILGGMRNPDNAVAIEDRATAIAWTIARAGPADCVLIAGKGHEDYQLVGAKRRAFSDYEAARASLAARAGTGQ
jgi:UDP-N-acetylmuramoyl-L-alanyl-D-glutamate--2,6-diaminopimelate ligase